MRNRASELIALAVAATAAGCASPPLTQTMEPLAMQTALNRARFDMDCPSATGTVLSSQTIEPVAIRGPERAEFTIGVTGCGKRQTVVVICSDYNAGCFAAEGGRR